jgi:hypothetical protein
MQAIGDKMKIGQIETHLNDKVNILGMEFNVGDRLQITFGLESDMPPLKLIAVQEIGYLVGKVPYSAYQPNSKSDQSTIILTPYNPALTEFMTRFDWSNHYMNIIERSITIVERLKRELSD